MPTKFPYKLNEEPVPGYRVVKFLGRGSFGEVWQAKAPGGTNVALKVIPDLSSKQAHKEFLALGIIKNLHHPNLVPINAVWLKDEQGTILDDSMVDSEHLPVGFGADPVQQGTMVFSPVASNPAVCELIIAMGLGHRNLFDRLEECREAGLEGIPVDELLDYMEESAKAIDYLNFDREEDGIKRAGIQHCDIKPHNILITGTSAQVCDFGLARVQGSVRATTSLAGTAAYAAPECLERTGDPSPTTDQYSLAITYYELRTGVLPYTGDTLYAVMQAALNSQLDLSKVSSAEEAVLRKAAARNPIDRYSSCSAMIKALRRAVEDATRPPALARNRRYGPIVAVSAAVAFCAVAWWYLEQRDQGPDLGPSDPAMAAAVSSVTSTSTVVPSTEVTSLPDNNIGLMPAGLTTVTDAALSPEDTAVAEGNKLRDLARTLVEQDPIVATKLYDQAIELQPSNAELYYERGVAHARRENFVAAIVDFEHAFSLDQHDEFSLHSRSEAAEAYLAHAKQLRLRGAFDDAIAASSIVVDRFPPQRAAGLLERGASYVGLQDYPKGLEDFSKSIELDSGNALAFSRRGHVQLTQRNWKDALNDINEAIRIDSLSSGPDSIDLYNRAIIYSATGKSREAIAELKALIQREPQNADAHYQLGLVLVDVRDYARALESLRAALAHEAGHRNAQATLALVLGCRPEATNDEIGEALQLATEAASATNHQQPIQLDALAAVTARTGQYDAAVSLEKQAIQLAKADPAQRSKYEGRLAIFQQQQPYLLPAAQSANN